jgi:hypothetical protein
MGADPDADAERKRTGVCFGRELTLMTLVSLSLARARKTKRPAREENGRAGSLGEKAGAIDW